MVLWPMFAKRERKAKWEQERVEKKAEKKRQELEQHWLREWEEKKKQRQGE